jgi:hypothetical protein
MPMITIIIYISALLSLEYAWIWLFPSVGVRPMIERKGTELSDEPPHRFAYFGSADFYLY